MTDPVITEQTKLAPLLLENVKIISNLAAELIEHLEKTSPGSVSLRLLSEIEQVEAAIRRLEELRPALKTRPATDQAVEILGS